MVSVVNVAHCVFGMSSVVSGSEEMETCRQHPYNETFRADDYFALRKDKYPFGLMVFEYMSCSISIKAPTALHG